MGFVFFWCGSIVLSMALDIKNNLRIYKDMADLGYKIDSKRYAEIQKEIAPNPDGAKINFLTLCIPFYNVLAVYYRTMQYNNVRSTAYNQLDALGVLNEMSDLEKKNYARRPTALNAFLGPSLLEMKLIGTRKVSIDDEDIKGDIYYKYVKKGKSKVGIKIVETTVDTKKLSLDEQKRIIIEARRMINENSSLAAFIDKVEKGVALYGQDAFMEKLKNNEPLNIDTPIDEESLSPERKKEIENLRRFKEYLLGKQFEKSESQENEEKGKTYTKK